MKTARRVAPVWGRRHAPEVERTKRSCEGIGVMDSVVLMSAILAAMAAGILLAYGVCLAMFRIFQIRVEQAQEASERAVVRAAQVAEG